MDERRIVDEAKEEKLVPSPEWHRIALEETAIRLQTGQEEVLDWEEAKRRLRGGVAAAGERRNRCKFLIDNFVFID